MADSVTPTFVEQIPSVPQGTSAIASATAPVIFADEFPVYGYYNGIIHISAEVLRFMPSHAANKVLQDRMVVAHLRMNKQALEGLKRAIEGIEAMIADPERNKLYPDQK